MIRKKSTGGVRGTPAWLDSITFRYKHSFINETSYEFTDLASNCVKDILNNHAGFWRIIHLGKYWINSILLHQWKNQNISNTYSTHVLLLFYVFKNYLTAWYFNNKNLLPKMRYTKPYIISTSLILMRLSDSTHEATQF